MESEINTHYGELVSTRAERLQLLPLQLYRLAMCLDILTEASGTQVHDSNGSPPSQSHFHKEKIFFRPARYVQHKKNNCADSLRNFKLKAVCYVFIVEPINEELSEKPKGSLSHMVLVYHSTHLSPP